ncbi:MAG TPA: hypothetical protein VLM91_18865 [Candidatus Methylomirabilis sp.]|nr:hypothetical protein [Candidatus Methylomirabilis sp.]
MALQDGVVEPIREAGAGGEARIIVELRTRFPGLGGTIVTQEGVAAALRIEYNQAPRIGHEMFIRHLIAKKLDDHFYRCGVYVFAHVPRPLGSVSLGEQVPRETYLYEWAFGRDGFSWLQPGTNDPIILHDWNQFVGYFVSAGMDLGYDTADPDDARVSQNVVHQFPETLPSGEMCSLWKRIDFGFSSIRIDFARLSAFVRDQKAKLTGTLRYERYEMLRLAVTYLRHRKYGEPISDYDLGRLEQFICDFRRSSLSHYALAFGSARGDVHLAGETQTLLQ